jgi:hypothetical protein
MKRLIKKKTAKTTLLLYELEDTGSVSLELPKVFTFNPGSVTSRFARCDTPSDPEHG